MVGLAWASIHALNSRVNWFRLARVMGRVVRVGPWRCLAGTSMLILVRPPSGKLCTYVSSGYVRFGSWKRKKGKPIKSQTQSMSIVDKQWVGWMITGSGYTMHPTRFIERARYYTESYKETEGQHPAIRAAKVDHTKISNGMALNMRLMPNLIEDEHKQALISDLVATYFIDGGMNVQFNVVDQDALIDAQLHPEMHQDLVVRVSGYNAYFVDLGKPVQDDIIERLQFSYC